MGLPRISNNLPNNLWIIDFYMYCRNDLSDLSACRWKTVMLRKDEEDTGMDREKIASQLFDDDVSMNVSRAKNYREKRNFTLGRVFFCHSVSATCTSTCISLYFYSVFVCMSILKSIVRWRASHYFWKKKKLPFMHAHTHFFISWPMKKIKFDTDTKKTSASLLYLEMTRA